MSFQKHIFIRPIKPLLTAILAALSLGLPALAVAQSPIHPVNDLTNQSAQILTQTTASSLSMFSSVMMIYLVPLVMILSVLGWMLVRRRQQTQPISSPSPTLIKVELPPQLIAQPPMPLTIKPRKSPPPLPISIAPLTETAATTTESTTTQATFSIQPATPRRQCHRCDQFFDAHLETCPNDTCSLPHIHTAAATTVNDPCNALQRTQCIECGRRYEDGTHYCYVDGMPLINDTAEDAEQADALKICRICGQESAYNHERCPHDNTELILINPSNLTRLTPAIPLLICSKCRQYAMPGTAFCPNDGELLTPLVNAKFAALPASGFGPRRKLCRKCGTRYSDACTFCSQDGTPLTPIN